MCPKYLNTPILDHPQEVTKDRILLDDVKIWQVLLRRVPKQVSLMGQTSGFTYYIPSRARVIGISC